MKEAPFGVWLKVERGLRAGTVGSRISNCRRVERHEGDLDALYDSDDLNGLLQRLNAGEPEHAIPIAGDMYNGTATLKNAVSLYRDFRKGGGRTGSSGDNPEKRQPRQGRSPQSRAQWPAWPQPKDEDLLELARAMAPFVRFLDPGIVGAVVEDNRRFGGEWSTSLEALGIDPAIYLWEGSPCAFPGVRRYAGSTEIAVFRKRAESSEAPPQCLSLDDNDYPKHLWSFVFTGRPFRKRGPDGYQLAHLFDHKEYGNRWRDELDAPPGVEEPVLPYGLFTSVANSVYAPGAFLRPTDLSPRLRSLIQRRTQQLYGDICCLVPPPSTWIPVVRRAWDKTMAPNLPAPIRPTRTGRPASARAAKRAWRFMALSFAPASARQAASASRQSSASGVIGVKSRWAIHSARW